MKRVALSLYLTTIFVLSLCQSAVAEEGESLIGQRVMVRSEDARLQHGDRVVGKATGGAVFDVSKAANGWLWIGRGWIHHRDVVAYDDALEFFTAEIARKPTVFAYSHRSRLWFDRDEYDKGIADCTEALRLNPNYAPALGNRGWARSRLKDYAGAIEDLTAAIRLDPKQPGNYVSRGTALLRSGDYDSALADLNAALKLQPDSVHALCHRGQVWFEKGEYARAIADHNAALKLNPNHAPALFHRGQARILLGHYEQAAADYERAALLDPEFAVPSA